jgi:hypothetical protein
MVTTKRLSTAAMAALLAVSLIGCGGDDNGASGGNYCDDLAAVKSSYIGLLENTIDQETFDTLRHSLHTLADEAPARVKDDWAFFAKAADDFNTALHNDGMTIDDVAAMQNDPHMEEGPKMDAVMSAAAELSSLHMARVQGALGTEAKKDCGVSLD